MNTSDFDQKLNELRTIERRMMAYTINTPLSEVMADKRHAQTLYEQIILALAEFRTAQMPKEG